jgi:hypothetical protein
MRARWKDPAFRAKQAAATRANWKHPAFRAKNAAAVRANWKDPAFRAKNAAATRAGTQKSTADRDARAREAIERVPVGSLTRRP